MKKTAYILSIVALAMTTAACGSQKAAIGTTTSTTTATNSTGVTTTTTTTTTTSSAAKGASAPAATGQVSHIAKIANSFGAWTTLKAGGSVTIGGGKSLSSSMQIRMERGKSIYISVRPMGIMEVGRLVITGDTLLVIDKIHKRYILESTKLLTSGIPLNVGTLQDIFLGRAFILGNGTLNSSMAGLVTLANVDGSYMVRPKEQYQGFEYDFKFDKNYHIKSLEVMPVVNSAPVATYSVDYSDVKATLAGYVATKMKMATRIGKSPMSLALEYGGLTWNDNVVIDTKIPSNYTRISGSGLLNLFSAQND